MVRPMTLDEARTVYPKVDDELLQKGIDKGYFLMDGSTYVIDDLSNWELMVRTQLFCEIVKENNGSS